tara:strand:- start:193 stop:822 length:630 start_codon:yes stop_codon:yes gene_type:complete
MNLRLFLLALICLVIPARAAESKTIVFIGDSLTAGYGLDNPSAQAYPALIQEKIDAAQLNYRTVNAGLSGDTTAGGLRRINWLLQQPIDILVIALGGNDGLRGVSPKSTKANLKGIIERTRAKYPEVTIMLAGMQMPANMGEAYRQSFQRIFPEVAQEKQGKLIPFLLEGIGGEPEFNQPDLIHPTAEGQRLIAETVWLSLQPLLIESR